nr:MAG TPA: hypothetical protein [Caudoviricetes sp.]
MLIEFNKFSIKSPHIISINILYQLIYLGIKRVLIKYQINTIK